MQSAVRGPDADDDLKAVTRATADLCCGVCASQPTLNPLQDWLVSVGMKTSHAEQS